jgi:hypothetical protein
MIVDRPGSHFIFVVPFDHVHRGYNYINLNGIPLTNKEYLECWGKWLVFGQRDEMEELARKLDLFVENRKVPAVKYDRKLITEFQLNRCVMCVYCHTESREDVWTVLSSLNLKDKAWMFERETMEKWLPGGVNLEKWISGRNLGSQQAKLVRKSAQEKFRELFKDENAIFTGIVQ